MIYFGMVKDVNDPDKLGRARVNVMGIHDNIETKDLAWSMVMMPGNTPATQGEGHSVNLKAEIVWQKGDTLPTPITGAAGQVITEVDFDTTPTIGDTRIDGTLVCGIFLDPTQQEFMIMGTLPSTTNNIKDNNIRVRGESDPNSISPLGTYQPGSTYAPEYPYNNVYETESGHVKEYDDTPGHERITERHMSGTQYEIAPDGSKNETIIRDNYKLVIGHDTLEVKGNVRVVISGNADIAVAKDLTARVGGNLTTNVDGNSETNVTGNLIATVAGTTQVLNTGDMTLTVSGDKEPSNVIIKSQYTTDAAAGQTTMNMGNIKLDGEVNITGNLIVDKTTKTSEDLVLDTHVHGDNNVNQTNTAGPTNP